MINEIQQNKSQECAELKDVKGELGLVSVESNEKEKGSNIPYNIESKDKPKQ